MNNLNLRKILPPLFRDTIKRWHKREHYKYQQEIADAVLLALVDSNEGSATIEIPIELPRQSGKTTDIVDLTEVLLATFHRYFNRPLRVGIFAPQVEQATTDFDRLKTQFAEISKLGFKSRAEAQQDLRIPEKWNSKAIKLYSKTNRRLGEAYIFPIAKNSNPESKTLDLIIVEEAQDVDDDKMKNAVFPMGASTNAPRIFIGTAGTRLCYFKSQLDNNPRKIIVPLERVLEDRRKTAEITGDPMHLQYERFINHEIETHGKDSDYVQRQYFLKWKIGSGQFTTPEILDCLSMPKLGIVSENKTVTVLDEKGNPKKSRRTGEIEYIYAQSVYVGIDSAKSPDQTVCTAVRDTTDPKILEFLKAAKEKISKLIQEQEESGNTILSGTITSDELKVGSAGQLCGWLALKGTNYEDQFEVIKDWLKNFENIRAIAIDSTGQGDFMPDKFERHTSYNIIRVKFSAETKDVLYKNLDQVIKNALTVLPDIPMDSTYRQFRKEMIELLKEYKGRFLSCHHPEKDSEGKPGHDDFPDSWALAEYAKTEVVKNAPGLRIL